MTGQSELRCTCSSSHLLGIIRQDDLGRPFLHVMGHKSGRAIVELRVTSGAAEVACPKCRRWTRVWVRAAGVESISADPA